MDWNELQNRVLSQQRDLMSAYRDAQAARVMEVHKAQDLHMARVTRQADPLLSRQHARANAVMHRSERSVDSCISEQSRSSPWTPPFTPPPSPTSSDGYGSCCSDELRSSPWTPHGTPSPSESLSVDSRLPEALRGLLSWSPSPPPAPHCSVPDSLRPDNHTPEELRRLPPWTPSPPPAPRRRLPQGNGSYIPRLLANRDVKRLANGQEVFTAKKQVDELKEEFQRILRRNSYRTITCRRAVHHMLDQVLEDLMQTVRRMQSSRHHQSFAPAPIRPTVFVPRPLTTPAPKSRRRIRVTPVHRGVPLRSTMQVLEHSGGRPIEGARAPPHHSQLAMLP